MATNALKSLIIPEDARPDVQRLLGLTSDQVAQLDRLLSDKEALRTDKLTYRRVAEGLGVSPEDALGLLSAIDNLRRQREMFDIDESSFLNDLAQVQAIDPAIRAPLANLFKKSEEDYFVEKVRSLRHALAPHLISARTIVDARPIFAKDRASIQGMLLVTFLEISTHNPENGETDAAVIQLNRKDIKKLLDALDDAGKKLDKLAEVLGVHDVYE